MAINLVLVLRIHQFILSVTVLGLSAYVVNWYTVDTKTSSPTQVNFLVAAPVLSMLSLAYNFGVSRFMDKFFNAYIAVAIDVVNAIFYFSGFIALAVFLNGLVFCRGTVCGAARAATAFSALSWVVWTGSAVLLGMSVMGRGGFRRPSLKKKDDAELAAEMKDVVNQA